MNSESSPSSTRSKRVLLGICGSIAAYKAADLVSRLREQGFEVRVLMTEAATRFITPLTLATLSGNAVGTHLWQDDPQGTEHIALARWADVFLIAPLSANTLAKLATGQADDWITTVALATRAPLILAPAMNTVMWENPITQKNCTELAARGATFLSPASGLLACGESGAGKLAEVPRIVGAIQKLFGDQTFSTSGTRAADSLSGQTVLITAGPTRSFIDSVRYMTNPSTGKMGSALAQVALDRGAHVVYVTGKDKGVETPLPRNAEQNHRLQIISVDTAEEMLKESLLWLPKVTGVIATAAVLDYRFKTTAPSKLKRSSDSTWIELIPSVDVLAGLRAQAHSGHWFVGFAAETDHEEVYGAQKLERKKLNAIFINSVAKDSQEKSTTGFGSSTNGGIWLSANGGRAESPLLPKSELGKWIWDRIQGDLLSS
jgi:phosphopantothenoylcysteine decarboxylase/phosphopantothenate--cysteine ligase